MKKGDKVTITDASYSRSIIDKKLIGEWLNFGDEKGKQYVIIETDCRFPRDDVKDRYRNYGTFNNTVIQAVDSGKVVFIEECFLEPVLPTHKVMVDMVLRPGYVGGEIIKISDKLYKEIKRSE